MQIALCLTKNLRAHAGCSKLVAAPQRAARSSQRCAPPPGHLRFRTRLAPQDRFVRNATQLYRSDFFPGLGWMLNRRVWDSVAPKWWVEQAQCQHAQAGLRAAACRLAMMHMHAHSGEWCSELQAPPFLATCVAY